MAFLTAPLAQLRAIIEGSHPAVPVTGRSIPSGTFLRSKYRGSLSDLAFPGAEFHRRYQLEVTTTRERPGDPPNVRAGAVRKVVVVEVSTGYLVSPDGPTSSARACGTVDEATLLGHSDHELFAEAFRWPGFWAGTSPSIVQIRPEGDVVTSAVIPRARILVTSTWAVTLSYAPGTVWT